MLQTRVAVPRTPLRPRWTWCNPAVGGGQSNGREQTGAERTVGEFLFRVTITPG